MRPRLSMAFFVAGAIACSFSARAERVTAEMINGIEGVPSPGKGTGAQTVAKAAMGDAGEAIAVANVGARALPPAGKVEVSKSEKLVRVLDRDGHLEALFPATIGSDDKPAPSGTLKVARVSRNPTYVYNPAYAF